MVTTKLWTIDEVAQLPDDGFRYALIRGELFRMSPPLVRHGMVANTVGRLIGNFVADHDLGLVSNQSGFVLGRDPDILLEPDVAFVRRARVPMNLDSYPEIPPDLVVEVASPSQSGPSIEEKTRLYLEAGVPLVWVVNPAWRTVRVHRANGSRQLLTENDILDGEDIRPGLRLPVAQLFA